MAQLIIVTNSASITREQRNALTDHLTAKKWETWHWIEDLWLIAGAPDDGPSIIALRSQINKIIPDQAFLIFTAKGTAVTGYAQDKSQPWIENHWSVIKS
jgi:hypothetical protein